MAFLASFVHFMLDPLHIMLALVLILLAVTGTRQHHQRRRSRSIIVSLTVIWIGNLVFPIVPYYATMALENRFPQGDVTNLDQIIVLGSWQGDGLVVAARGEPEYGAAIDRLLRGVELARTNEQAELVLSGGLKTHPEAASEADIALMAIDQLGVDASRVRIEDTSTNTAENARFTTEKFSRDGRIGLVTSAAHMPRAMATFRANGLNPVAIPTDYQTTGMHPRFSELYRRGLSITHIALREWVGLAAYRLLGRTETLLPRP